MSPLVLTLALSLLACGDKDGDTGGTDGTTDDGGTTDTDTDAGGVDSGTTGDAGGDTGGGDTGSSGPIDLTYVLEEEGGCEDLYMWATDKGQATALWVRHYTGLAQLAHETGTAQTESWDLSESVEGDPSVRVWLGSELQEAFCAIKPGVYDVEDELFPESGTLDIEVIPVGLPESGEYPAQATFHFQDVVMASPLGAERVVSDLTLIVNVGYAPD